MTWDEARSSCMNDGGDLMGHETPRELGLYLFRGDIKEALKLYKYWWTTEFSKLSILWNSEW